VSQQRPYCVDQLAREERPTHTRRELPLAELEDAHLRSGCKSRSGSGVQGGLQLRVGVSMRHGVSPLEVRSRRRTKRSR
jgi:hypothetical protein